MRSLRFTGEELQMLLDGRVEKFWPASLISASTPETSSEKPLSLQSGEYRLVANAGGGASAINECLLFEWYVSSAAPRNPRLIVELLASEQSGFAQAGSDQPASGQGRFYVLTPADALRVIRQTIPLPATLKVVYFQDRFLTGTVSGLR